MQIPTSLKKLLLLFPKTIAFLCFCFFHDVSLKRYFMFLIYYQIIIFHYKTFNKQKQQNICINSIWVTYYILLILYICFCFWFCFTLSTSLFRYIKVPPHNVHLKVLRRIYSHIFCHLAHSTLAMRKFCSGNYVQYDNNLNYYLFRYLHHIK